MSILRNYNLLFQYCAIIAAISGFKLIIAYCANMLHASLFVASSYKMSSYVIRHIHDAPLLKTGKLDPAYFNQRISQDAGALIGFSTSMVTGYISRTIEFVAAFLIMHSISPLLAYLTLASLCIYFVLYRVLKKPLHKRNFIMKEEQAAYFAKMYEQLHQVKFVKAHSLKEFFQERLHDSFSRFQSSYIGWYRLSYLFTGLDGAVTTISQTVLYILGGYTVIRGNMTIGSFTIISNYFSKLLGAASFYFSSGSYYQESLVSYQRITNILSWETEITGITIPKKIREIHLEGVNFSYENREVLRNISLVLRLGRIYAFTGKNGAGKSTLAQLIRGLFPYSYRGRIAFNGVPIEKWNLKETRARLMGYVEQDAPLLADEIEKTVYLGTDIPDSSRELIHKLQLLDFVANQPSGWNTVIHPQNNNLSGGEKQRVSISRAILKDPDVLIFDEPSSALDSKTIKDFLSYLKSVKEDKIILLITHDEQVIEICDEIIALDA